MTNYTFFLRIVYRDNVLREDYYMSDKMLVTQALDERDLLVKKIADKIAKASFIDTIKPNEDKVYAKRIAKDEYVKQAKTKDEKPLGVVEAYVKENTTELVDPLDVKKKLEALEEKRNTLLTELDTQIKVSNATTLIEVE